MVVSKFVVFTNKYPIVRGMLSYAVIFPTSSIIQQTIAGKTWETYDWKSAGRYMIFGTFYISPILYGWIKLTTRIWPKPTLAVSVRKALIEQVTYGPFAISSFFVVMNLMEGKTINEAVEHCREKFFDAWKVAICYWPFVQVINFSYIREKNRVPFISVASLVWNVFMAYMHALKKKNSENQVQQS